MRQVMGVLQDDTSLGTPAWNELIDKWRAIPRVASVAAIIALALTITA
jgi:hypothetical protein